MIEFFRIFFLESNNQEKDMVIRFYLPVVKTYIEYYKTFESPLLEYWTYKIKPYLLDKYPKMSGAVFTANSDIHYLIELIDDLKNKYQVKEIKADEKIEVNIQSLQTQPSKEINKNIEKNKEAIKDNTEKQLKQVNKNKLQAIKKEEDIKMLRMKNEENISSFLLEFIKDKELNKKRANSMMSLRHSKTISSFTTCDDSICLDEIREGKYGINLNLLMIDNSEINNKKKRTKDIIQKSHNLYQEYLNKKEETKGIKNKIGNINKLHHNMTLNLQITMFPKYQEIKSDEEQYYIEYKNKNKTKLMNISPDLMLKKIIFDDFISKNLFIIHHFCQQCFCFIKKEFFLKIFNCYKFYKEKGISFEQLENLIKFINILVIEMFSYYEKVNSKEMQITLLKKNYIELVFDLLNNFKEEIEDKINIDNNKNNINEIKENENISLKKPFRFDSYDLNEEYSYNDFVVNKTNLLNMNLNIDEKIINIITLKNKNNQKNLIDSKEELKSQTNEDNNKKSLSKALSFEINKENSKLYKITKTLKRTITTQSSIKFLNSVKDEIKEENNENNSCSSSGEEICDDCCEDCENKEESSVDSFFLVEKGKEFNNPSEMINSYVDKVFQQPPNFISKKEQIMQKISYIMTLLEMKEGQIISKQDIEEIKSEMQFYTDIQIEKKNIFEGFESDNDFSKERMTSNSITSLNRPKVNNKKVPIKNYFCITDWDIEDIGNKLTQVSKSFLNKIQIRELLRGVYLKKDKKITSPNVINCINNFNKLTSFIIEDIISYDTPKLRASAYESWVQICDFCKTNKNYNDCLAIYSALNNYIITGLNKTLKEIKPKIKSIFEQISKFCSVEDNYRNIRNDMLKCEKNGENFVPYLGMLLRDINFIEESSKYINENGFINIEKIERINNLLENYFKYKNEKKKNNKKIPDELNFFNELEEIKEEELEKTANNIEPKFKFEKQNIKRLTNIDKKFFKKNLNKRNSVATSSDKFKLGFNLG